MKLMIIMRGIPGSGKSTLAKKLMYEIEDMSFDVNMYSTDDFWYDESDQYVFDIKRIGEAHAWNFDRVKVGLDEYDCVIVDNTNIVFKDFKNYIRLAISFDFSIMLAEPKTDWKFDVDECDKKNTHNLPRWVIDKMLNKYQSNAEVRGYIKDTMDNLGHHVDVFDYDPFNLFRK